MTKESKLIIGGFALLLLAGFFVAPFFSRADVASSTDFLIQDSYIGFFSGYSSSTSFQETDGGTPFVSNNNSSTDFGMHSGPDNFSNYMPETWTWRWYSDANDEKPTSSLAAENVSPTGIGSNQPIKLRLDIIETGGAGADNVKFALQYSPFSDFSAEVANVAEIVNCGVTSTWCYASVAGGGADNAVISSTVLSTSGSCVAGVGTGCGTHNTSGVSTTTFSQVASTTAEYEFTVEAPAAPANTTYFFRPVYVDTDAPVPVFATSSYPSLTTQGSALTFSVGGLPVGTSTAGVVTNVSTTAVGVPFGTLTIATSVVGAQQLSVTTNAINGYELYALQDAPLTDTHGDKIPGVSSTNLSPLPWTNACVTSTTACYGYHPTSPVLSGSSARFAANDTYAALTSTAAEIGYSGFPVTSSSINVVYRIQAGPKQLTGAYQNNIVYIVTPSF